MIRKWPRHFSAIVAVATLASCHQAATPRCCAPWGFPGAWHWVLEDEHRIKYIHEMRALLAPATDSPQPKED